jgi:multicomponent Na+:H+ antiporter subunit G
MLLISVILMLIGAFLVLIAGIGIIRMPDVFLRMAATTKAATIGISTLVLGTAFHFNEPDVWARALAIALFLILTSPVAAHAIGRAAYNMGDALWGGTQFDDIANYRSATVRSRTHKKSARRGASRK